MRERERGGGLNGIKSGPSARQLFCCHICHAHPPVDVVYDAIVSLTCERIGLFVSVFPALKSAFNEFYFISRSCKLHLMRFMEVIINGACLAARRLIKKLNNIVN